MVADRLRVSDLSVRYAEETALHRVSFELTPGRVLGLIGPNGAGKSTLIRAVSGVIPHYKGSIVYGDRDLTRMEERERATVLAVVPQTNTLPVGFTVAEVVLLGRTPHLNWTGRVNAVDEEIATASMRSTHTLGLAHRLVTELSGGEYQRVLLARAFAQQAPVLLLDEPTTHLDLKYQVELLERLREAIAVSKPQQAALIVMHDLNLVARYADDVMLLKDGGVMAAGAKSEVLTEELLSKAYDLSIKVYKDEVEGYKVIAPRVS